MGAQKCVTRLELEKMEDGGVNGSKFSSSLHSNVPETANKESDIYMYSFDEIPL
jgi:hypothetical protein